MREIVRKRKSCKAQLSFIRMEPAPRPSHNRMERNVQADEAHQAVVQPRPGTVPRQKISPKPKHGLTSGRA